ncbi:MAG: PAS domain S-box protein [Halapricum sp.]
MSSGDSMDKSTISVGLETVLDSLPIPAYVLDSEHTVVEWSTGLEPLLGLSRKEMFGTDEFFGRDEIRNMIKTLGNKVVDDPLEAERNDRVERVDSVYTDTPVYESKLWLENDAGEQRYIRFNALPIFEDETFKGVVQLCRDETEHQRRQEHTER